MPALERAAHRWKLNLNRADPFDARKKLAMPFFAKRARSAPIHLPAGGSPSGGTCLLGALPAPRRLAVLVERLGGIGNIDQDPDHQRVPLVVEHLAAGGEEKDFLVVRAHAKFGLKIAVPVDGLKEILQEVLAIAKIRHPA